MLKKKRTISKLNKFLLYFKTAPFLIGEVFLIVCVVAIFYYFDTKEFKSLFALLAFIPAIFFIKKKYKNFIDGSKAKEYGEKTLARLSEINNTVYQHNKRRVKEYVFLFEVGEKSYRYIFDSAYHRHLEIGAELRIYYLAENPNICVIPLLFNVSIDPL